VRREPEFNDMRGGGRTKKNSISGKRRLRSKRNGFTKGTLATTPAESRDGNEHEIKGGGEQKKGVKR